MTTADTHVSLQQLNSPTMAIPASVDHASRFGAPHPNWWPLKYSAGDNQSVLTHHKHCAASGYPLSVDARAVCWIPGISATRPQLHLSAVPGIPWVLHQKRRFERPLAGRRYGGTVHPLTKPPPQDRARPCGRASRHTRDLTSPLESTGREHVFQTCGIHHSAQLTATRKHP